MPGPPPSNAALQRHAAACQAGEDGYLDPDSGLFCLTSGFLKRRGWCCAAGCRHCPFPTAEQQRVGRPRGVPAWPWPSTGQDQGGRDDEPASS